MANEKNLRPCEYKLSQEEAKKGGRNSVKARREKKTIQALLNDFLKKPAEDNSQMLELAEKLGISGDTSIKKLFTIACVINAMKDGDLDDLEKLIKLTGEQISEDAGVIAKLDQVIKGIDDIAK